MLRAPAFEPLPINSIRPEGWLLNQLRLQAKALCGHLDEFWPDVMRSGWIGGDAEGWERGPYWLDGVVPLASLLDDERLKSKVRRWMDYILSHQYADGWLGPIKGADRYEPHDPWPVFVALKAMTQYHDATADARVIPAMQRFFARLDALLDQKPLFHWGRFRWMDLVLSIFCLFERTREMRLIELAQKVQRQGYDWGRNFAEIPYKSKMDREQLDRFRQEAGGDWGNDRFMACHGVNVAMGLKAPAVAWRLSGDPVDRAAAQRMLAQLDQYHGQPNGLFSCDEHLAGLHPSQGTELCAVVEMMFSMEVLLGILGDPLFADRLETLAFNALPATFSKDMWTHQYIQQANQVICKVSPDRIYTNNGPEANLFGIEPNYGCCTANSGQGWPKFAAHLWMKSPDGGLAAMSYAPCAITTRIRGVEVHVKVETDYPFAEQVRIIVTTPRPVEFPLRLHIPEWANGAVVTVEGEPTASVTAGGFYAMERVWIAGTTINLHLPMLPRLILRDKGRVALARGPLIFSLLIEEDWRLLRGEPPRADWEVHPASPWNVALKPGTVLFTTRPPGARPFSPDGAPVRGTFKGRRVDNWHLERNAASEPPASPSFSPNPLEEFSLIPYGCTNLRVTEFPTL